MGTAYGQWRGLALFLVFFQGVTANADWLDDYARAVPWTQWYRYTHNGGWTSTGSLAKRSAADVTDYFIARAQLLGNTTAAHEALFQQFVALPLRMKNGVFHHGDYNRNAAAILDYFAAQQFKRAPAGFVELLWSFKYSESKRPLGATAYNLLRPLAPADRAKAIQMLRASAKPTDSVERGLAYTYDAANWKRLATDKTNISWTLRKKVFDGKFGIDYQKLQRTSGDPRISDLDMKVSREYDANGSGILSNLGKGDKLGEIGEMEARGNYGRNDATLALLKLILNEIAHGSPEQGVGIYLTLHPFTKVALLRSIEHEYYIAPTALLLDATIEDMQNAENPQRSAVETSKVGAIVASWIVDSGEPKHVARILPLMKHRALLLREIKASGVDFKSESSPFSYLEPLTQAWGELLHGDNFVLNDETPIDYAAVLQLWADGKVE